jgi:hypothetical protein
MNLYGKVLLGKNRLRQHTRISTQRRELPRKLDCRVRTLRNCASPFNLEAVAS